MVMYKLFFPSFLQEKIPHVIICLALSFRQNYQHKNDPHSTNRSEQEVTSENSNSVVNVRLEFGHQKCTGPVKPEWKQNNNL